MIENVPGLSRTKDHSILDDFTDFITRLGYNFKDGVINASHYHVPQNRMRYLLIASRVSTVPDLPRPSSDGDLRVRDYIGVANGFSPIGPGHRDGTEFNHSTMALSGKNLQRIALTPPSGGNRSAWAARPDLQIDAYRENDKIFRDVYGRMSWGQARADDHYQIPQFVQWPLRAPYGEQGDLRSGRSNPPNVPKDLHFPRKRNGLTGAADRERRTT